MFDKIVSNSRKTSESYKTRRKFLTKLVSNFFRRILGEFSETLRINRKPWENDFGLEIFFRRIVGKLSVNVLIIFIFAM